MLLTFPDALQHYKAKLALLKDAQQRLLHKTCFRDHEWNAMEKAIADGAKFVSRLEGLNDRVSKKSLRRRR